MCLTGGCRVSMEMWRTQHFQKSICIVKLNPSSKLALRAQICCQWWTLTDFNVRKFPVLLALRFISMVNCLKGNSQMKRWTINISSVVAGGLSTWQDNLHECKSPSLLIACVFQWAASEHGSMSFSLSHLHGSCAWPWICAVGYIPFKRLLAFENVNHVTATATNRCFSIVCHPFCRVELK